MEEKVVKSKGIKKSKGAESSKPTADDDGVHYHYHMNGTGRNHTTRPTPGVHYHYYYEPPKQIKKRSSKPTIAGALLIIHAIIAIVLGFAIISMGVFITDAEDGFFFFGSESKGDIFGTVTMLNGTPIEGAAVSIEGESLSALTDSDGSYIIYNVPSGNHKIIVEKEGYNTIEYRTFIEPSDTNWENDRGPGYNNDNDNDDDDNDDENEYDFTLAEGDEVLEHGSYPPFEMIAGFIYICGTLLIILSIITLLGGIAAIRRKNYRLAVAGAITGILTIGLFPLIALFILLLARDEFKKQPTNEV